MPKLAAAAVTAAIRQLAALDLPSKENSAVESFLTGKRFTVLGGTPTIDRTDEVVAELFNVLPDHPRGRIRPFDRDDRRTTVAPKWSDVSHSGRKTVWNVTTRGGRTLAAKLFTNDDIRNGLRPDASHALGAVLSERPPLEGLAVLLLRDEDFAGNPNRAELEAKLASKFALSAADLGGFCVDTPLGVSLLGSPEWQPSELPAELRPHEDPSAPSAVAIVAADSNLVVDDRVRQMVRVAIASSKAVMLVGPPGTGKTALLSEVIDEIQAAPSLYGFADDISDPLWQTPEESWTTRDLIGGETLVDGALKFRPGFVLEAIIQNRWIVLDEANRADMDKIFGGLLTWLSGRAVKLGRASTQLNAPAIELGWNRGQAACEATGLSSLETGLGDTVSFLAGDDWRLLGTYNAVDAQRVFRFGQALGRRFARVPIPPMTPDAFRQAVEERGADLPTPARNALGALYDAHYTSSQPLGPALFLAIIGYVRAATAAASTPMPSSAQAALTEGYLVHVGAWIARLEASELADLKRKIVTEASAISNEDWEWLVQLLPSLA